MSIFRTPRWHEPEQGEFWRYLKGNNVLETIQPALTLLYKLPVKPTDLNSFFAEFLENGAKSAIQHSLIKAEFCYKRNQLEEARNELDAARTSQKISKSGQPVPVESVSTSIVPVTNQFNDGEPATETSSKTTIVNFQSDIGSVGSIYSEEASNNDINEMDIIIDFIQEYQEIDPFGMLFDFNLHDWNTFDAAADHEQALVKGDEVVRKMASYAQLVGSGGGYGRTFFDSKQDMTPNALERADFRQMTAGEKLIACLRKFQEQKKALLPKCREDEDDDECEKELDVTSAAFSNSSDKHSFLDGHSHNDDVGIPMKKLFGVFDHVEMKQKKKTKSKEVDEVV